jgi:opacity protein-like surface antigen
LSAEANYGFDRNTQRYFSGFGESRIQSDVYGVTADVVVKLPLHISKFSPYALAGGGGLIFHPTGNGGGFVPGADTQAKGAFLYGAGADYVLTNHFSLRAEYRGFVYKDPVRPSELEDRYLDAHSSALSWHRVPVLGAPRQPG